jgi:hypothetical protein
VSSFEFVLITIAIVLGFGISEILAGWGRALRHRQEVRPYPLQLAASAYVLYASIRYLWLLWDARDIEWLFLGYLLTFVPALCLALAAYVVRGDPTSLRRSPKEQYFGAARPLFLLLAGWMVISVINVVLWLRAHPGGSPLTESVSPVVWAFRPAFVAACLFLAWSRSPRWHAIGWAFFWGSALVLSSFLATSLTTPS